MMFYDAQDDLIGGIYLYFTSTPQYFIGYCSSSHVDIPNLPSETEKVWTITFTRTSDVVTLVLHCNEVEVFNVVISGTICGYSRWSENWSRKPASKILFLSDGNNIDTASDYFRKGKSGFKNVLFIIRALVSARGSEQKTEKRKAGSEIEVALASATICFHDKNRKSQFSRAHKTVSFQPICSKIVTAVLILVTNNW